MKRKAPTDQEPEDNNNSVFERCRRILNQYPKIFVKAEVPPSFGLFKTEHYFHYSGKFVDNDTKQKSIRDFFLVERKKKYPASFIWEASLRAFPRTLAIAADRQPFLLEFLQQDNVETPMPLDIVRGLVQGSTFVNWRVHHHPSRTKGPSSEWHSLQSANAVCQMQPIRLSMPKTSHFMISSMYKEPTCHMGLKVWKPEVSKRKWKYLGLVSPYLRLTVLLGDTERYHQWKEAHVQCLPQIPFCLWCIICDYGFVS